MLKEDGRWTWEVGLLFDTCSSRDDDWVWPDSLADQDDLFLFPGELRCDWEHQGEGDAASVAVYNRGNETLNLMMEISGGGVVFEESNEPYDDAQSKPRLRGIPAVPLHPQDESQRKYQSAQ